jgi:hypothetical protein
LGYAHQIKALVEKAKELKLWFIEFSHGLGRHLPFAAVLATTDIENRCFDH